MSSFKNIRKLSENIENPRDPSSLSEFPNRAYVVQDVCCGRERVNKILNFFEDLIMNARSSTDMDVREYMFNTEAIIFLRRNEHTRVSDLSINEQMRLIKIINKYEAKEKRK